MKKCLPIILVSLLSLSSLNGHAATKCTTANANMEAGKTSIRCLNAVGKIHFVGTTIEEKLKVTGSLLAKEAKLNEVVVVGKTTLNDSIVSGPLQVTGDFEATNTTFKNKIKLTSSSAIFTNCHTQSIEVNKMKKTEEAQVVLNEGTVVEGDLTFLGGGVVIKKGGTVSGKITGGKEVDQ